MSQRVVEVKRGADESQMRESLREVVERFAAATDFLSIQPHVIGVSQHLLKKQSRFREFGAIDTSGSGERFHQPNVHS